VLNIISEVRGGGMQMELDYLDIEVGHPKP
jgi:hypothetical protein